MFSDAYEITSKFTLPLIVSYRLFDGTVKSGLGSFVILNNDGWIITAAHNLQVQFEWERHQQEILAYRDNVNSINSNTKLNSHQKKKMLKALKANRQWITDCSIWWGASDVQARDSYVYWEHDIAFIRMHGIIPDGFTDFPKIKNPENIRHGTSLCKCGFPFYNITPSFDESRNMFNLPLDILPIARFPIEGIFTRNVITGKSRDSTLDIMFLETSSPGLKGQSGGPIFDREGHVYAIQSQNVTMPLGFTGIVQINGKNVEENQFINVGMGVHAQTIVALLKKHEIKFQIAQ